MFSLLTEADAANKFGVCAALYSDSYPPRRLEFMRLGVELDFGGWYSDLMRYHAHPHPMHRMPVAPAGLKDKHRPQGRKSFADRKKSCTH